MNLFVDQIKAALELPNFDVEKAWSTMAVTNRVMKRAPTTQGAPRVGSVLLLLYPENNNLHVVLTKRPDSLKDHSGQISFPGGKRDGDESLGETALRETHEEIGIESADITLLGELHSLYIPPSDFEVNPFVGWCDFRPKYTPNPAEVETILEPTLTHLLTPSTIKTSQREFRGATFDVPYYDVDGHWVWGATAIMLSEFLGRWKMVRDANEIGTSVRDSLR